MSERETRCFFVEISSVWFLLSWQQLKETPVNSLDDSVLHVDVGAEGLVIVHDLGSFNQETVAL